MIQPGNALVIALSPLARDPRVTRQIEWLSSEGWSVDSLGLGQKPTVRGRDHFAISELSALTRPRLSKLLIHLLLPYRLRFKLLYSARFPKEVSRRVAAGEYDLVIFNDINLAPWSGDTSVFTEQTSGKRCHLDLHEYHPPELPQHSPWRRIVGGYYKWTRSFIPSERFTSRSTVAGGIGALYSSEYAIGPLGIVRNAPALEHLAPSPSSRQIRLVHHGVASWERGLAELLDAIRLLPSNFTLTLFLIGSESFIADLRRRARDVADRVTILPPAPMADLAKTINRFDLEVMFYPPQSVNLQFALPNKLFEAVQGRLGLVIGPSPMMAEIVEEFGNGIVAAGWTPEDLSSALEDLTAADVEAMKRASDRAAKVLNSEEERKHFLAGILSSVDE